VSDDQDRPETPAETSEEAPAKADDDVVMVHRPTDDGQGYHVLRVREGNLELGQVRQIREGSPIHGDVVRLTQRKEHERLYDVEVLVKSPKPPEPPRHGPAQVATDAYRTNWDLIFGPARAKDEGGAPN